MSGSFPVAAATATLADRLHALIGDAVPGARVATLNPGAEALRGGDAIVNLYLFRTVRNGSMSNLDLPTRSAGGAPTAVPTLVLTLDYMISFFGDDAQLDPQRLLGLTAAGLWAYPIIEPAEVRATIAATPWLAGTAAPTAAMRVAPMNLTPEETARVWSEFVHVPYQLTQFYTLASVALPEPVDVPPVLPVRQIGTAVQRMHRLVVLGAVNALDPALPLAGGGVLALRMVQPAQQGLDVVLNGERAEGVTSGFDADGAAALLVPLDARQPRLAAGALSVQVVRRSGFSPAESGSVDCVVTPGLAGPATVDAQQVLTVPLALPVGPTASAAVILYPAAGQRSQGTRIACAPRTASETSVTTSVAGVPAGSYLLSVEIDGIASTLDHDGSGFTGPIVAIPGGAS